MLVASQISIRQWLKQQPWEQSIAMRIWSGGQKQKNWRNTTDHRPPLWECPISTAITASRWARIDRLIKDQPPASRESHGT
eukprot:4573892-Amphidinium_carterae.4